MGEEAQAQLQGGTAAGGGEGREGYFYRPTVLKDVISKMHIVQEELFGQVTPIIISSDDVGAMKLANDSEYGLINPVSEFFISSL